MLSHANVLSSVRAVMGAWRWQDDDVLVHSLPLTDQHGLTGVHATLLSGSRAVIEPALAPAALCAAIAAEAATVLFAVPAVYEHLLSWERRRIGRFLVAAPGDLGLRPTLAAALGPGGGSDRNRTLGALRDDRIGLRHLQSVRRPTPARVGGHPLPGVEVVVADSDGEPLEDGADGEVLVRGPQVFDGYWRDDHASGESLRPDGWFRTGDIGRFDPADGYLSITGRVKKLTISGGLDVYPQELVAIAQQDRER